MRKVFTAIALALSFVVAPVFAQVVDPDKAFVERAKHAVGILYSQDVKGGMRMHCTVTAYKQTKETNLFVYRFISAAHCVGSDRPDKEKSASTASIPFFVSLDESKGAKKFWPAKVLWVGYQTRGEDFAVFEVKSAEDWATIPIGDSKNIVDGAGYWNFASPLGLGRQVQEGIIASVDLDRPVVEGDINWAHTFVLQQSGVNGGSSGSPIVSKDTHAIVATLVGTVGGSTIIAIPISRFTAVQKAIDAGKYKFWKPEMNVGPDGEVDDTK